MKKQIYSLLCGAIILSSISLGGCAKDDSVTAPSDATITANPSGIAVAGLAGDTLFPITIVVTNGVTQMQNAEVYIDGGFAVPRDPARYQFYRDGAGFEPVDSGFIVETDENGTYTFSIKVAAGAIFDDFINLRSGAAYGTVELSFTEPQ